MSTRSRILHTIEPEGTSVRFVLLDEGMRIDSMHDDGHGLEWSEASEPFDREASLELLRALANHFGHKVVPDGL